MSESLRPSEVLRALVTGMQVHELCELLRALVSDACVGHRVGLDLHPLRLVALSNNAQLIVTNAALATIGIAKIIDKYLLEIE